MSVIPPDRPVDGRPFRAHLRHVSDAAGVPWPILVLAAGLPLGLGRRLVEAPPTSVPTIPAEAAARLLSLTPASARALGVRLVPAGPATGRVRALLRLGWTPVPLARTLGLTGTEFRALVAGTSPEVTRLVDLRVAAVASGAAPRRSPASRAA